MVEAKWTDPATMFTSLPANLDDNWGALTLLVLPLPTFLVGTLVGARGRPLASQEVPTKVQKLRPWLCILLAFMVPVGFMIALDVLQGEGPLTSVILLPAAATSVLVLLGLGFFAQVARSTTSSDDSDDSDFRVSLATYAVTAGTPPLFLGIWLFLPGPPYMALLGTACIFGALLVFLYVWTAGHEGENENRKETRVLARMTGLAVVAPGVAASMMPLGLLLVLQALVPSPGCLTHFKGHLATSADNHLTFHDCHIREPMGMRLEFPDVFDTATVNLKDAELRDQAVDQLPCVVLNPANEETVKLWNSTLSPKFVEVKGTERIEIESRRNDRDLGVRRLLYVEGWGTVSKASSSSSSSELLLRCVTTVAKSTPGDCSLGH